MATLLIDTKSWLSQTSIPGAPRTGSLKLLDAALEAYEKDSSGGTTKVAAALVKWQKDQGPGDAWKKTIRNRNKTFEHLEMMLTGKDSDVLLNNVNQNIADDFAHTRLGVLYFFSSMKVESDMAGDLMKTIADTVGTGVGMGTKAPIDKLTGVGKTAANAGVSAGKAAVSAGAKFGGGKINEKINQKYGTPAKVEDVKTFREKITEYYNNFVEKLKNLLRSKFGDVDLGSAVLSAITAIVTKICAEAGGMIGDVVDGIKGFAIALDGFYGRIKSWLLERDVTLVVGYPKAVVDGVNRAMVLSALDGVQQLAKSGLSIGLGVVAAGAQPIVKMVLDGAVALFRFVWRIFERARIGRFLTDVASHWTNRESANALHKSPLAFAAWYRSHAIAVPILAAMTLNSGICGSKMHFLQLFKSSGEVVSQKEFDKGVTLLDDLKPRCGEFIRSSPHKFVSTDPFVISLMANHLTDPADTRNGIWAIIRGEKKLTMNNVKKAFA